MGQKTPLYETHLRLGARIIDFGGWDMPVQYAGVIEEHNQVRQAAGLFDVSHMGEFEVVGPGAETFLNMLVTNDVTKMADNQCQYTPMCYENGTVADDLIVYRHDRERYMLVVNAGNIQKDWKWVNKNVKEGVKLSNVSASTAEMAVQGPLAEPILQAVASADLKAVGRFMFQAMRVAGREALMSRTGYTGEDGFEVYVKKEDATKVWDALMKAGEGRLKPIGLGARDTLRLEAALMLYGNDIDETTTPIEATIGWTVKLDKPQFIGKEALLRQKTGGVKKKLVGFELLGKGIARHGYKVNAKGVDIGHVTSGTFSPTLRKSIGLAYVKPEYSQKGAAFDVIIRDRPCAAEVVGLPFYKRAQSR